MIVLLLRLRIETNHLIRARLFSITSLVLTLTLTLILNLLRNDFSHKHALFDVKSAIVLLVNRSLYNLLLFTS